MSISMIFWILFFIVLITAFFALLPTVRRNSAEEKPVAAEQPVSREPATPEQPPAAPPPPRQEAPVITKPPERAPVETPTQRSPVTPVSSPLEKPAEQTPSQPASQPVATQPATQPTVTQPVATPSAATPVERPAETRDRSIYFIQETRGGAELLVVKVNRKIRVSDSPLFDCLNALLAGPTAEEKARNIINLIPPNTRILWARVEGNTAYINFNNAFQYNTDGREGFDSQLKQIVWTATEFPNVHDVQILIEGNRLDFLGEGIMIGSPLRR